MTQGKDNIAYIDGANLHKGIQTLGWKLDYRRFRVWLSDKYRVTTAYIFLGRIPKHEKLYSFLQKCGFILIFKEVIYDHTDKAKGNCDSDLVLRAVQDAYETPYNQAILVTSDGDYASLVKFLMTRQKMRAVLSPSEATRCSVLLKRTQVKITYLNDQRLLFELKKEKAPGKDSPLQGSLS